MIDAEEEVDYYCVGMADFCQLYSVKEKTIHRCPQLYL